MDENSVKILSPEIGFFAGKEMSRPWQTTENNMENPLAEPARGFRLYN